MICILGITLDKNEGIICILAQKYKNMYRIRLKN